jgi:uncharacterized protein YbjT (DUF2867 family)
MIIVTGANGQLGRQVVQRLLARVPAERIGLSVRDPEKAKEFAARGVRVRRGSFTEPDSLADSFEGATQVLVVSVDSMGGQTVPQHRTAIEAAVAAGARRVLYTSQMGSAPASEFEACRDHAATEEILRTSGAAYTALRNGFYATSAVHFLGQGAQSGRIELPQDGPVAWTAHADLAEATAVILADEGRFDGPTPPLTGPRALDFAAMAPLLEQVTGRPTTRVVVPDADFRAGMVGGGAPEVLADQLLGIFAASRAGEFDSVHPALAELIGREPLGLAEVLREQLPQPTA